MATPEIVHLPLPHLPEGWDGGEKNFRVNGSLSPVSQRTVEPVGPHFLAHARRVRFPNAYLLLVREGRLIVETIEASPSYILRG